MNTDNNRKFKDKYRTTTARLKYYDYSSNGGYFITICTKNCVRYFGNIKDEKMQLTEIGIQAEKCWQEISNHFPFVIQDSYIIMPNHIHGIILIDKPDEHNNVETQDVASPHPRNKPQKQHTETLHLACKNTETQNLACNKVETQNLASLHDII